MPYALFMVGAILGAVFLLRLRAQGQKTGDYGALLAVLLIAGSGASLLFVLTGRWPAAAILMAIMTLATLRLRSRPGGTQNERDRTGPSLSREEALEILGLAPGASLEEIARVHRTLMAKLHPDRDGSGWLAAKLNQARDALLPEPHQNKTIQE